MAPKPGTENAPVENTPIEQGPSQVDALVEQARAGYRRVGPAEAARARSEGALLVDIRPAAQREEFGEIPGALVIERNVLEWRLDPTSPYRHPAVTGLGQAVIIVCQSGYASSLAAASLQQMGLRGATDLAGGFEAWVGAGLEAQLPQGHG